MADDSKKLTTTQKETIRQVAVRQPIRVLMYGGANKIGDNAAFYYAAKNVERDYNGDMPVKSFFISSGAGQIINFLNQQKADSIQSLDIFCHGDANGLYFMKGSSLTETKRGLKSANLYCRDLMMMEAFVEYLSEYLVSNPNEKHTIKEINFSVFTVECKIEIHGCNTANDRFNTNMCSLLSENLYRAGKVKSVVIGHATKANPNINDTNDIKKQDYRHGIRAIYHNGKKVKTVTMNGRIESALIKSAIAGS